MITSTSQHATLYTCIQVFMRIGDIRVKKIYMKNEYFVFVTSVHIHVASVNIWLSGDTIYNNPSENNLSVPYSREHRDSMVSIPNLI